MRKFDVTLSDSTSVILEMKAFHGNSFMQVNCMRESYHTEYYPNSVFSIIVNDLINGTADTTTITKDDVSEWVISHSDYEADYNWLRHDIH